MKERIEEMFGVVFVGILVEAVLARRSPVADLQAIALFCVLHASYAAAAAKAWEPDRFPQNAFGLAVTRGSAEAFNMLVLVAVAFAVAAAVGFGVNLLGLWHDEGLAAAVVLFAAAVKLWPLAVVSFAFEGRTARFGTGTGGWIGAGFGKAWQLTGMRGVLQRCSLPVVALGAAGGAALALRARLERAGWPTFPLTLLLWALVVPYLTTVAYAFTAELRDRAESAA